MSTNQQYVGTTHNLLNYSGLLFNKGDVKRPFSTLIGGKFRTAKGFTFTTSLDYTTAGGSAQPAITETASLTAPNKEFVTRTQNTNYIQIFQRAIGLSYAKLSANGQLSGLNVAGQVANPSSELDFQIAQALEAMMNDLEYTFLNGSKQEGTYDDVAYKTCGITSAISTNSASASSAPLSYWLVAEAIQSIYDQNQDTSNLVLMTKPTNIMQLNADAAANGLTFVPASRNINGLALDTLITPFGSIAIVPNARVASGTALIVNPDVCAPVYLDVPEKGNFFVEQLAKTGAEDAYQLYGQAGLDYGCEVCHAKITNLSTSFVAPSGRPVYVSGGSLNTKVTNSESEPVPTKTITG